ncbi:hypothetical protein BASA83_008662 [Batrachochytrium salamandrivorans]|nr:hypothetical protein BASA81_012762 [Batrachochytrium salamandrivorans]KAH9269300.1 hypothetical protein BASA83_008662 [Batrachochytrium salamandrivorans]
MRLISFVAISFLAITVSAYPGLGTPSQSTTTEDIQSPPSIAPQGEQQFDQDGVQAERARLTAAYEKEDESFSSMNSRLEINRQEITDLTAKANLIAIRFRETDLDDDDRRTLKKEYYGYKANLDVLIAEYNEQSLEFVKIGTACDFAWAALNLLLENQGLIVDYNAKDGVKTGPSPNSLYDLDFLRKQTDHFPKRIKNLHDKLKEIKANEAPPSDELKTQTNELENKIRRLGVQHEIAKEILQKHEPSQTMGARIRGFFNSCLPNGK